MTDFDFAQFSRSDMVSRYTAEARRLRAQALREKMDAFVAGWEKLRDSVVSAFRVPETDTL